MCRVFFEAGLEFFDGEYKCPVEGMQPEVTRRKHFFGRTFCTRSFVRGVRYHVNFYLLLLHVYIYIYTPVHLIPLIYNLTQHPKVKFFFSPFPYKNKKNISCIFS